MTDLDGEIAEFGSKLTDGRESLTQQERELEDLRARLAGSQSTLALEREARERANTLLKQRRQEERSVSKSIATHERKLADARVGSARLEKELATAESKVAALEERRAATDRSLKDLERSLTNLERTVEERRSRTSKLETDTADKKLKVQEIRAKFGIVSNAISP